MAIKSADQITIIDVTDAYSVILTSEAYTFVGGTGGVVSGASCSTQAVAFCGSNQCSSVVVTAADIVCPSGISASVANSGSANPTITFTTTTTISSACEATIPVVVDGITVNKKFSFAVALKGATGSTGATGATGKGIKSVTNYYLTNNSSSGVTTATTGWATAPTATTTSNKYIWCYQKITYTDDTTSNTTPAIIGTHGATGSTGAAGKDALVLTITSSNGTVFKNNSGSTVLTAHVYKGGVEQSITDAGVCGSLGSIKWYVGSSTTPAVTSKTLTVSASEVTNSLVYTAQLEQ